MNTSEAAWMNQKANSIGRKLKAFDFFNIQFFGHVFIQFLRNTSFFYKCCSSDRFWTFILQSVIYLLLLVMNFLIFPIFCNLPIHQLKITFGRPIIRYIWRRIRCPGKHQINVRKVQCCSSSSSFFIFISIREKDKIGFKFLLFAYEKLLLFISNSNNMYCKD